MVVMRSIYEYKAHSSNNWKETLKLNEIQLSVGRECCNRLDRINFKQGY